MVLSHGKAKARCYPITQEAAEKHPQSTQFCFEVDNYFEFIEQFKAATKKKNIIDRMVAVHLVSYTECIDGEEAPFQGETKRDEILNIVVPPDTYVVDIGFLTVEKKENGDFHIVSDVVCYKDFIAQRIENGFLTQEPLLNIFLTIKNVDDRVEYTFTSEGLNWRSCLIYLIFMKQAIKGKIMD